jgi:hypothetical protein
MITTVKSFFYFRKFIFLFIIPALLAIWSLINYATNDDVLSHAYFYTTGLLCIITGIRKILEHIFEACSETYYIDDYGKTSIFYNYRKITILFPKYSKTPFFHWCTDFCWYIGMNSPLIIPHGLIVHCRNNNSIYLSDERLIINQILEYLHNWETTTENNNINLIIKALRSKIFLLDDPDITDSVIIEC